ncbi:hypothetical protein ALC60_03388 [Trachymyrmex zeteki]|uniref:Uncharacterized protein n=1 Tax=Mycetomoellerius zeteki TaxID=64791 RepID=A0A151XAP2_9HYME|nr:hypothetical protein ALC60_03388 [Trachymyrmex zeteki]
MMSMQSSDVMECETSASEASGNVSSADTSTWSTYLLGRIAWFPTMRANFSGEEKRCDDGGGGGSDGGVGGDGAPGRRYAEKGEEKEEVVNVEKPRRNLKRRCIDSNRQLSYSTAADLRDMSRLIAGRDKELRAREEEHRAATSEQERARSSESNAPRSKARKIAMGNPDKERLFGFKHATHVRMILRSQPKNRVCEGLYVRIGTRGADRDAPLSKGPQYPYPLSLRSAVLSPTCVPDDGEHRGAAQYAALWLNGNAFSCTTDAIGFSRLSAGSTTSLMQPVLRRHWRAATVSPPIYEANTPGRLY